MKEIVNILYHNTQNNSLNLLRKLVDQFIENGYEVMISSHSSIPQDLIEKCACYFYDNKNVLADMSSGIIYWEHSTSFEVYSPYMFYGSMLEKSYCPAAHKNLLNAINSAYQLGYDILHIIEYDVQPQFEEYLDNARIISEGQYDIILYGTGEIDGGYSCIRLKDYDTRWNFEKFYEYFMKYEGRCELATEYKFRMWVGEDRILKKSPTLAGKRGVMSIIGTPHIVLYEEGDYVHSFIYNWTSDTIKDITIYHSGGRIQIQELYPSVYHINLVSQKDQPFFFHVFIRKKEIFMWEIDSPQSYQKIVGRNSLTWR
jgi:hypothetical protein